MTDQRKKFTAQTPTQAAQTHPTYRKRRALSQAATETPCKAARAAVGQRTTIYDDIAVRAPKHETNESQLGRLTSA